MEATTQIILKENGQLKEEVKRLHQQVSHWRSNANDANHMLARIDKMGPKRYADNFYNPALERIINKLYKENQILVDKVNDLTHHQDGAQLIIEIGDLKTQVQKLRNQLEQKFKDNQRLQMSINEILKTQPNKKLESISRMTEKCNKLQMENRNLKSSLILQENVKNYLKGIVDSLRKELLHLFCKCVADEGDKFLNAIKELDNNGIPDILFKPLCQDQSTSTTSDAECEASLDMTTDTVENRILPIIAKLKIEDTESGYDSGVASLTDELRQISIMLRQSDQNCIRKDDLILNLKQQISDLTTEMNKKENEHHQVVNDMLNQTSPNGNVELNELREAYEQLEKKHNQVQSECESLNLILRERDSEYLAEIKKYKEKCSHYEDSIRQVARQHQQQGPGFGFGSQAVAEPYQGNFPWTDTIGNQFTQVSADGDGSSKKPKRQSSEPSMSFMTHDGSSGSSPKRRNQFDYASETSWRQQDEEKVLQCEFCKKYYPVSMIFEHIRTCSTS